MSKLQENIDNFFKKRPDKINLTEELLYKLIMEEFGLGTIEEKETPSQDSTSVAWDGIPFLSADEIGWGGGATKGQNATDSRRQIERFLSQIGVQRYDIKSKLKYLEAFFSKSEKSGAAKQNLQKAGVNLDDPRQTIAKILSYLTFYKTLTMILQNFNAASAGFTFESFVAVLLGGKQVPTGEGTIADLTAKTGRPISLKLLDEKSASVDGSLRDLINDFAGLGSKPVKSLRYIVVLKDLQGDGPELEGVIKFYQFDYTIDTILHYLTIPTGGQEDNLRLSIAAVAGEEEPEIAEVKPQTDFWSENFDEALTQAYETVDIPEAGWAENTKDIVLSGFDLEQEKIITHGKLKIDQRITDIIAALQAHDPPLTPERVLKKDARNIAYPYFTLQDNVKEILKNQLVASRQEYKAAGKAHKEAQRVAGNYASKEDSLKYLKELQTAGDEKAFWNAMTKTYGYLAEEQWSLSKSAIEKVPQDSKEQAYLGRLFIGRDVLEEMVNMCRDTINEKVFDIFRELKVLTENLQAYFAEGMQNSIADQAIQASDNIGEKTAEVAQETGSEEEL